MFSIRNVFFFVEILEIRLPVAMCAWGGTPVIVTVFIACDKKKSWKNQMSLPPRSLIVALDAQEGIGHRRKEAEFKLGSGNSL